MKTLNASTHTNVTFTLRAHGNDFVKKCNEINSLVRKHNGQDGLYSNQSHLRFDNEANVIGTQMGSVGGTVVFHAHACANHKVAASELVALLESYGLRVNYEECEVVKTHRADGTPYARPQTFIERI